MQALSSAHDDGRQPNNELECASAPLPIPLPAGGERGHGRVQRTRYRIEGVEGLWLDGLAEFVAAFGLLLTIVGLVRVRPDAVPVLGADAGMLVAHRVFAPKMTARMS